jgi:hypothetical protein
VVDEFGVDTAAAQDRLGWKPAELVERSIRGLLSGAN